MAPTVFRPYSGPADAQRQYDLWLRATEGLPYAWRSNLTNVRALSRHAPEHPGARLFAERDGEVVGYIGTHAPFQWKDLGMAVPFGFPWTWPRDEAIERELYDRMLEATPGVYAGQKIDFYIQRFRRSWKHHHALLAARGWREAWADPILARPIALPGAAPAGLRPIAESDLAALARIAAADPTGHKEPPDEAALRQRFAVGWQEWEHAWLLPGAGGFAIEVREPWAEVKMFHAAPGRLALLLAVMDAKAADQGAGEVYFTLRPGSERRHAPLEEQGFRHADDDIFVTLDQKKEPR